ncbi:MAG: hypothetical protein C0608_01225 [Deltaproteobacteria bacterium]|nr:MAG: hypothetical protein C0608_01225 [Deltaproteobacteria bacterium]
MKRVITKALLMAALLLTVGGAAAAFREGPVLLERPPVMADKYSARAERLSITGERLPDAFLKAAEEIAGREKSILIIGHTDSSGPKLLNKALGLQYAIFAANRLSKELGIEPWLFYCASSGESPDREDVWVELFPYEPPAPPKEPERTPMIILEPVPEKQEGNRIDALKDMRVDPLIFATNGPEGETLWEASTLEVLAPYFYPAGQGGVAYGGSFKDERYTSQLIWREPKSSKELKVRVESVEKGWARLVAEVPETLTDVVIWAGPIPYPVTVEKGSAEAHVALLPLATETYAQGIDPRGLTVVGEKLPLPPSMDTDKALLAVLIWQGKDVDLDIHGWRGEAHTHPQDPDPDLSDRAAEGVRVLFDGEGRWRSSAIVADKVKDLELVVTAFNDFGSGAECFIYLLYNPGDEFLRYGKILGPRKLVGEGARWPAYSARED